jgi:HK97 family phage portal protein
MGLLFNFVKPEKTNVEAALASFEIPDFAQFKFLGDLTNTVANRREAMSVPAVARARNIICGTIGSLPLEVKTRDNSFVATPRFIEQPDPSVPGSIVYTYTAEDLLFNGVAYWQIKSIDETTLRPNAIQWVSSTLVTPELSIDGQLVIGYLVNGKKAPDSGIGSLITFSGLDEGLLHRAGRTIKTAAALERATLNYANEPVPSVVLKSGNPLSKERVTAMLDTWRKARTERSTAFLNDQIELQQIGFNAQELQMTEARQYLVSEIARLSGIPEWYLGAAAGGSMTYSNVSDERRTLIDFSLRPIMTAIEQRLTMDDITLRGYRVRFNLDDFLRGNALERADVYQKLIPLGVMTVDEARAMEDLVV